jgi:hypothetical protein
MSVEVGRGLAEVISTRLGEALISVPTECGSQSSLPMGCVDCSLLIVTV